MTISDNPENRRFILVVAEPYYVPDLATQQVFFGTDAFITRPTDAPANALFNDIINNGFVFTRSIYSGSKIGGRSFPSSGAIIVKNTLGQDEIETIFDDWIDENKYTWDGRKFTAYMLEEGNTWDDRTQIYGGVFESIEWGRDDIQFPIKDRQHLLDKIIQQNFYDGTGGNNGGAALKGKAIPLGFGPCYNATPAPVDPVNWLNQIHDGEIEDITEVRDNEVPLITTGTATGGTASSLTLNASSISGYEAINPASLGTDYYVGARVTITAGTGAGQKRFVASFVTGTLYLGVTANFDITPDSTSVYRIEEWISDYSGGRFTLLAQPAGQITVDFKGSTLGGIYSHSFADIAEFVVREYGGFAVSDIDETSIDATNTKNSSAVNFYTGTDPINILDVLDYLADGIGAFYGVSRLDKFFTDVFEAPAATSELYIIEDDIKRDSITREQFFAPVYKTIFYYRKNWTVQDPANAATSVPDEAKALYAQEYLSTNPAIDLTVSEKFNGAVERVIYSSLTEESAAETERDRQQILYSIRRSIYSFETFVLPLQIDLNETINVTHSRLGLSAGVNMVVVESAEDGINGICKVKAFR